MTMTMYPLFNLTGVQTYDLWIMNSILSDKKKKKKKKKKSLTRSSRTDYRQISLAYPSSTIRKTSDKIQNHYPPTCRSTGAVLLHHIQATGKPCCRSDLVSAGTSEWILNPEIRDSETIRRFQFHILRSEMRGHHTLHEHVNHFHYIEMYYEQCV